MRNFTNPLNNIRIASPCSANWNEMYGNDRKRFCGDCKLNVYNLSDMTRQEAENLLMNLRGPFVCSILSPGRRYGFNQELPGRLACRQTPCFENCHGGVFDLCRIVYGRHRISIF